MRLLPFVIFLIPFIGFSITSIRENVLTKEILKIVKNIDYDKWEYLTHPKLSSISSMFWVRPMRFIKFVKAGNDYDDPELTKALERFSKNRKLAMVFWGIFMFSMIMFGIFLSTTFHQ